MNLVDTPGPEQGNNGLSKVNPCRRYIGPSATNPSFARGGRSTFAPFSLSAIGLLPLFDIRGVKSASANCDIFMQSVKIVAAIERYPHPILCGLRKREWDGRGLRD